MSADADHRIDHLLKLAEASWKCLENRRTYEWKAALALWTALAAFAGTNLSGRAMIGRPWSCVASVLLFGIGLVFTFVWTSGLHKKHKHDRDLAEQYWIAAEAALVGAPETMRATKRDELQQESMWQNWSHSTQIIVTWIFVALAIISMYARDQNSIC